MKNILLILAIFSFFALLNPEATNAQVVKRDGCTASGECVGGKLCVYSSQPYPGMIYAGTTACGGGQGTAVLGEVKPPKSITRLNFAAQDVNGMNSGVGGIGLIIFLSRILQFGSIIAGLWVMFNVISAAFIYITKPDSDDGLTAVKEKLTMSAVGLSFIVGAFAIAGIIGLIFFGDAGYILSPQLIGALDSAVVAP